MTAAGIIVVFAKPPVPGLVKTRLVPPLTPEEAAEFHLAALDDVLAAAERAAPGRVELHVAGDAAALQRFRERHPGLSLRHQTGDELGDRLAHALAGSFERGAARALIVGSDHPTLPAENLVEAFTRLRHADVTFGPSRDGGYYLVGMRRRCWPAARPLFEDIPWSTSRVLETSLERARSLGLKVALLPEWYDVDQADDLDRLRRDARPESRSARFLRRRERG